MTVTADTEARPGNLPGILDRLLYKPGWTFRLVTGPTLNVNATSEVTGDWKPLTTSTTLTDWLGLGPAWLQVTATVPDSRTLQPVQITHQFAVPRQDGSRFMMTEDEWIAWLWKCITLIELHEAGEFLTVLGRDPSRPFYPEHGPGSRPYLWKAVPA